MERTLNKESIYTLNIEKIHTAYNALRDYHNAPSNNDDKELDALWNARFDMNSDELTVFYDIVQSAYLDGRKDGYRSCIEDL